MSLEFKLDFKKENVINFINFNKATFKPDSIVNMAGIFLMWVFGIPIAIAGVYKILSIILIIPCNIVTSVLWARFDKNGKYSDYCLYNGSGSINFSLIALLGSYKAYYAYQPLNFLSFVLFIFIYIIVLYLWLRLFITGIKKDKFKDKFGDYNAFTASISIVVPLSMIINRVFMKSISQDVGMLIVSICCMVICLLTSGGILNFIKYYFMKKYNIEYYE